VTCAAPGCGRDLPAGRRRFCSDLCRIRGRRSERGYDNAEFARMITRMVRNLSRRVGGVDIDAFGELWRVRAAADEACAAAIDGLRRAGFSWHAIGDAAGQTGQGVGQWRRRRETETDRFTEEARPP
jgi:hypothetical protein